MTKSKLNTYFKTIKTNEQIFLDNGENELIDQNIFIEILTMCAYETPHSTSNPSPVEKVNKNLHLYYIIMYFFPHSLDSFIR